MSFTERQCERMADSLRNFGFELPDEWDNDVIAKLASCIIDGISIEILQPTIDVLLFSAASDVKHILTWEESRWLRVADQIEAEWSGRRQLANTIGDAELYSICRRGHQLMMAASMYRLGCSFSPSAATTAQ